MIPRVISLVFVRHGQGYHNVANKSLEHAPFDAKSTHLGTVQARSLQQYFISNEPDLIYSSSLSRCVQTMEYSIVNHTKEVFVDDRLMERGGPICNKRNHKSQMAKLTSKRLNLNMVADETPWHEDQCESDDSIFSRGIGWFIDLCELLQKQPKINRVAVFTHYEFLYVMFTEYFYPGDNYTNFFNCETRDVKFILPTAGSRHKHKKDVIKNNNAFQDQEILAKQEIR